MISTAQALTAQFYEWERRGRGWQLTDFSCDLESPFVPFFGHFLAPEGIIDDGKVWSLWDELLSKSSPIREKDSVPKAEEQRAFPFSGTSGAITIFSITLPSNFKQSRERIEQLLIMLSYRASSVSFELIATAEAIKVQWTTRDEDQEYCYSQIKAFFPECSIMETFDDEVEYCIRNASCLYTVDFGLEEEFMRPLAMCPNLEHDPYTPLFGILERLRGEEAVIIQVLFSGVHNAWGQSIMQSVCDDYLKQSFFLDAPEMPQLAKEKVSKPLYAVTIRAVAASDTMPQAGMLLQHIATALVHASRSQTNALMPLSGDAYTVGMRLADIILRETHRVGMLLNASELATFVHFPSASIYSTKLQRTGKATKAAPKIAIGHSYELGMNIHQGKETAVSLSTDQRLRHLHIIGATGTGKSTLLKSLILQDINQGVGLMCLDPHGDLIEDILRFIPEERIQDVVLIDPSDTEFPIGLNMLHAHSDIEKELLASDLVAMFRRFSTSWGDQMNSVFANAILAFVFNAQAFHLGDLRRFLIEGAYRTQVLATVTDSDIAYYWHHEFPLLKGTSIASILTRLDAFLRPKVIRNIVCQKHSLDFAQLMDSKKIILVKLSQGLLGTENSFLLGAFIVSKLQQIALSRQLQQSKDRVPFFCYIDEFQHFITPSMATILSGARKYGVGLVLAHQDMAQVSKYDTEVASSIIANAGTRICFRLGDTDAKRLDDGFSSFTAADLQNLPTGEAIIRVNTTDNDCNLSVVPHVSESDTSYKEDVINYSRIRYSVPIQMQPAADESLPREQRPHPAPKAPIESAPRIAESSQPKPEAIREHRYLQMFIKAMAETHGYIAQLEVPTPDGGGQVDVLLEKDGVRVAVEISVSTSPEWELHNIKKCLAAGYEKIVLCSNHKSKLAQVERLVKKNCSPQEQQKIFFVAPDEFQNVFPHSAPKDTYAVIKGYRVKVQYEAEGTNRQQLLQSIVNTARKP